MLPPPLPSKQEDTEPGLGLLALKAENARLRAAQALPAPAKLRRWVVALVVALSPVLYPIIAHYVPQYASVIHDIVNLIGKEQEQEP